MELLQKIPKPRIRYIEENCTHCGKCAAGCPTGAIEFDNETGSVMLDQQYLCIECCQCVQTCRSRAMVLADAWEP